MIDSLLLFEGTVALVAGAIHGVLGFGFPLISTPLFAIFMDLKHAILLTLFPTIATNALSLKRDNSFGDIWKAYWPLILSVGIGSLVGTNLLVVYNSPYYKLILVAVIVLYLTKGRLKISLTRFVESYRGVTVFVMGFLSGFVGGISNIMIPVIIILLLELHLDKKRLIGVMSFYFITNKTLQVIIFGIHDSFDPQHLMIILYLVIVSSIGFKFGSAVQDKIDEQMYKKVLHVLLWCVAFYLTYATFYM